MVYIVGAGSGDSGLITQKGLECIKKADIIIYDHLVNPTLLSRAKDECRLIYAGKTAGNHHLPQEEINRLLTVYASHGIVVRLKGGDPFIFGRGGEEADMLYKNNIPYEIVPGISSCYSAAEYCGIPVTHREYASSFHVITGHEKNGSETVDYGTLAKLNGTLVFLMGLSRAENISKKLIEGGKSEDTKTAIISNGTTDMQKCVVGTLKNLADMAKDMPSPAVIIVGDTVALQREWFKPCGKKILTTATKSMNARIRNAAAGMDITEIPLIKTVPINFDRFIETNLNEFSHIIFTSVNGVEIFFDYMRRAKRDIRVLCGAEFAVTGKKTAAALAEKNICADIIPQKHCGAELAKLLCKSGCKNALLIRAENGSSAITDILSRNNITFTDLALYKTKTDFSKKELLNLYAEKMDYIIFSSGSAVKAFHEMSEKDVCAKFISIGSETTKFAEQYGFNIYKTAAEADADGIIKCIRSDIE